MKACIVVVVTNLSLQRGIFKIGQTSYDLVEVTQTGQKTSFPQ